MAESRELIAAFGFTVVEEVERTVSGPVARLVAARREGRGIDAHTVRFEAATEDELLEQVLAHRGIRGGEIATGRRDV